jgi:branched-chain amino acid transport system ATP-binding protein
VVILLYISNLTKSFGGLVAVNDVNLHIGKEEIVGLVGPNGAGKSTLLNLISGMYRPDRGSIMFMGTDITMTPSHKVCKFGITKTFQLVHSFPEMTALENVMVGALFGDPDNGNMNNAKEKAMELLQFVGFSREKVYLPVKNLNLMELKYIQLARALATNPKLILLDEITTGLNPTESQEAVELIKKLRSGGISVLLVEHIMRVIMGVSDRIVVLDYGEKIADGTPEEVANNEKVIESYLGEKYIF